MKKNITKKFSKATIFLTIFVALTMVFTIYQTSVNSFVGDVASEFNVDEEEILGYIPLTVEAASISSFTSMQLCDAYEMKNTWGSLVEKSETYTFSGSLSNDAYKRAAYYGGAIKFKSYFTVTKSGNHSSGWYVTASGGASNASTSNNYISSGTNTSSEVNLPGGTTTFTGYLNLRTKGKAATQQTARAENCGVTLVKGESTAPSISGSDWQTSNSVTVSDSQAGINTIRIKYYDLNNTDKGSYTTGEYSASGTASSSRITSRTITFDNYGKYVITATDNVGNSSSKTIWYYNPTVKASILEGEGKVAASLTSSGVVPSATTSEFTGNGNLYTGTYYLYAQATNGYYFNGWTSAQGTGTHSYSSSPSGSNSDVWKQSPSIANPPKYSTFEWKASFKTVKSVLTAHKPGDNSNRYIPDYDGDMGSYPYDGGKVPVSSSLSNTTIKYVGIDGTTYDESTTAPTYAGKYRVRVWITNGNYTLGYTQFTFSITAIDLYVKPVIANKNYDGTPNATCTGWTYDSKTGTGTSTYTVASADALQWTTNSGVTFSFPNKNVAWGTDGNATYRNITMTNSGGSLNACATMTTTKSGLNDVQKAQLLASYNLYTTFNTSTGGNDIVQAIIYPITLNISLASNAYDHMLLATPFYVADTAYTSGTYYGKVYDGTTGAYFTGLTFEGLVADDVINFKSASASRSEDFTSTGAAFTLQGTINANYQGSNPQNVSSSISTLKTIATETVSLGGNDYKNYTLSIEGASKSEPSFVISVTNKFLITQVPLSIEIDPVSNPSKTYDGTTTLQTSQATYKFVDSSKIVSIGGNAEAVSINFASGATLELDNSNANCFKNGDTEEFFGSNKIITLKGFALSGADKAHYYLLNTEASLTGSFRVYTCPITATVSAESKVYDGTTSLVSTLNSTTKPTNGTNFEISKSNVSFSGKDCGDYTIAVTVYFNDDNNNYHLASASNYGSSSITQNVNASITQKSIVDVVSSLNATAYNYTSNAQYSTPTLIYTTENGFKGSGSETLQEGNSADYTFNYYKDSAESEQNLISAENIKNVGTYVVKVTAVNSSNYKGSITLTFAINKSEVVVTKPNSANISIIYGDSYFTTSGGRETSTEFQNIVVANANNSADVISGGWYYVESNTQIPNVGTYYKTITFSIDANVDLNNYSITAGNEKLVPNQTITLTISKKAITLVANSQGITYGEIPSKHFTSDYTAISLETGYSLVGNDGLDLFGGVETPVTALSYPTSVNDINVSNVDSFVMATTYPITFKKNVKDGASNYEITWIDGIYTVSKRNVTFTAISQSKVYGEVDPDFSRSFTTTNTVVTDGDVTTTLYVVGILERASGENVGAYLYTDATIRPSFEEGQDLLKDAESKAKYFNLINYNFTSFGLETNTSGEQIRFNVTKKLISIEIANDDGSIFGNDIIINQDNFVVNGLMAGDDFKAIFSTLTIERTNANGAIVTATGAGTYYLSVYEKISDLEKKPLSLRAETPNENLASNYNIYFNDTKAKFIISKRDVTVKPASKEKTYGEIDPDLTNPYEITGYVGGETLYGSFQRESGENVGSYVITQGTFGVDAQNYNVIFDNPDNSITLTILKLEVTLTPVEGYETVNGVKVSYNRVTYDEDAIALRTAIAHKAQMLSSYFSVDHDEITNKANGVTLKDNDGLRSLITSQGGGLELPNYTSISSVGAYELQLNAQLRNVTPGSVLDNYTFKYKSLGLEVTMNGITETGSFLVEPYKATIIPIKPQNLVYGSDVDVTTFTFKAVDPNGTHDINEADITGSLGLNRRGFNDGYLPVGDYPITLGNLTSDNYQISLDTTTVYLTVVKKDVLVTLSQSVIDVEYGEEEPIIAHADTAKSPYTFTLSGLVEESHKEDFYYEKNGGTALSRVTPNVSSVDRYNVTIGNLNDANGNYNCILDGEYTLNITQRHLLLVPDAGYTSVYGSGEYMLGSQMQQPTFKLYYYGDATKPALIGSDEIGGIPQPVYGYDGSSPIPQIRANVGKYAYSTPDSYNGTGRDNYFITFYSNFANDVVENFDLTSLFDATSYSAEQQAVVDAFATYGVDITKVYVEITPRPVEVRFTSSLTFNFGEEVTTENVSVSYDSMNGDVLNIVYTLPIGLTVEGYSYPVYLPEEYEIQVNESESTAINPNYIVTFQENDYNYFSVNKVEITLTPVDGQGKVYLESNPTSYQFSTVGEYVEKFLPLEGDVTLVRAEGETPGDYAYEFIINEDSEIYTGVALYECYDFVTKESFSTYHISKAQAEIKIGDEIINLESGKTVELEYTYLNSVHTLTPELLVGGKDFDGNDVATLRIDYLGINQGTVDNGTINVKAVGTYNFYIGINALNLSMFQGCFNTTFANLTIKVLPYDLGALNPADFGLTLSKTYGDLDPEFNFEVTSTLGDKLMGKLVREEGENVGSYLMTAGEVTYEDGSASNDYTFSVLDCYFEITKRAFTLAPSANLQNATKVYGNADYPIFEQIVAPVTNEELVATFTREMGENVGTYDLSAVEINSTNYEVTLDLDASKDIYVITKKSAKVVANGITKTFNAEKVLNSELTYTVEGVLEGDTLQGSLSIEGGEPVVVGTYKIVEEGFTFSGEGTDLNPNYEVTFLSNYVVINQANVIVLPDSVTYEYGDAIAPFSYTLSGTVYDGYPVVVVFNELTDTGRGVHNITVNKAEITALNPNYNVTIANATVTITVRRITITSSHSVEQVYGNELTAIPYEITEGSLLDGDVLEGALAPDALVPGTHGVNAGTLQNPNYEITYELSGASYVITKRTIDVIAVATSSVYGDELSALTYEVVGLVNDDVLEGALECNVLSSVGDYEIGMGTLAHPYYVLNYTSALYSVTPRAITLTIRDVESEYGQELGELSYYLSKGMILEGDELNVVLTKEEGDAMGVYEITGSYNNANYLVTFVNGTYTIHKFKAVITVETKFISFIEDGKARSIVASCDSGAEITYVVKGEVVSNNFRDAGKYVVELSAEETDNYYAPEKVTVYVTINRPVLSVEANGIDVTLTTENGFDPNLTIEMEKLPVDYMDMLAELTSKQKIVRAFTLTSINEDGALEEVSGKATIRVKVPTALAEQSEIQIMLRENGNYNIINVENVDGYVTLEVEALSSFAFIMEETTNYLVLALIGVGALIMLASLMVFLFRKRV